MGSDMKEANMLCPMKFKLLSGYELAEQKLVEETICPCEQERCAWWCENKMCAVRSIADIIRVMYRLLPIEKAEEK